VTLTARVSAFFLGWLGLALVGFAATVYLGARANLCRQTEERLQSRLDTLLAATEVHADYVEWEPNERALPRSGNDSHEPVWLVGIPDGRVVDRSGPLAGDWLQTRPEGSAIDPSGLKWRLGRRQVTAGAPLGNPHDRQFMVGKSARFVKYHALDLVVAVPVSPVRDELNRLAWLLSGLTVGLWLTAAVLGRSLCRRTLAPVSEMAVAAREISPGETGERLTVRSTGDELEDLGRAFNDALGRLEEAFERQRRFTGDASHQLRTPLAAMLGQVEVALRRDRDVLEYRDTLRSVADEVRHLHRVTEALLFLARADADAALPDLRVLDLAGWANEHIGKWRTAHPDSHVHLDADRVLSPIRAHPELLAQLIDNLLDNAVKYGSAGGTIHVRIGMEGESVSLSVQDSGSGIALEDLPHVFDPFVRSAAARTAGVRGVGLGLSVARRIAEAMGARLTAESEPGRGSRFTVRFPIQSSSSSSTS
jgi:two-component system, OmpR family, sensor kinase